MKKILLITFLFFSFDSHLFAAEVKNVTAKQAGNRLLFEFDITGDEGDTEVNVIITVKGKTYANKDLHLEGDFGKVQTGKGKKIWWNLLQDFPRGHSGDIEWEITAGGKGIVTDNVTKLMWQEGENDEMMILDSSISYC